MDFYVFRGSMKKTIRFAVDRKEGDLLVLVPDEGERELLLDKNQFDFSVGDVLDVTLADGAPLSATLCKEETERRKSTSRTRLAALFAKGKRPGA